MPELPEVETVRQTLLHLIVGKKIREIKVLYENIVKEPKEVELFKLLLQGESFTSVDRKGKFLVLYTENYALVSHLRMEGKYMLCSHDEPYDHHTHVFFLFDDGTELRYRDVRKFGTMHLVKRGMEFTTPLSKLGPDAIEESFTANYLQQFTKKSSRPIKVLLLDQAIVAGLGNIYVDEVLHHAGVHPETPSNQVKKKQLEKIVIASKEILEEAIVNGGTTIRSYLNAQGKIGTFQQSLKVYGKENEPCHKCGKEIEKLKVGGRGTHICPRCQKLNKH